MILVTPLRTLTRTLLIAVLASSTAHTVHAASPDSAEELATKTLVWPDGTRYVGGVVNKQRSGKGTIFWQDGTRFVGQFANDKRNGPGIMILPDGTVYNGFFQDDELVDGPPRDTKKLPESVPSDATLTTRLTAVTPSSGEASVKTPTDEPTPITATTTLAILTAPVVQNARATLAERLPVVTLTDDVRREITETVNLWAAAWSEQNVPQYLANYASGFAVPGNQAHSKWEVTRRTRITRPRFIELDIRFENYQIVAPSVVEVQFRQTYRSDHYNDVTDKVLRLEKTDAVWRIIQEGSL